MDEITDLADALAIAEADLQEAAILMIREPALVALVGRKVATAISCVHKARQKLASGLNRQGQSAAPEKSRPT